MKAKKIMAITPFVSNVYNESVKCFLIYKLIHLFFSVNHFLNIYIIFRKKHAYLTNRKSPSPKIS